MVSSAYGDVVGAAALAAGAVLIAAGLAKARRPSVFAAQITDYGIVPVSASRLLARLIPVAELSAGALLVAGLVGPAAVRQAGAGLATGLFAVFLAALGSAYARGRDIACACFGGNGELETVGAHAIVRTALLLVLAALAIGPAAPAVTPGGAAAAVGLAVLLAALVALVSELTRLLGPLRRGTAAIIDEMTARAGPDQPDRMLTKQEVR
jgi:hypothetical protein